MKDAKIILENQFDEMISTLRKVISFNTEKSAASTGAPFGQNIKDCLDYVLQTANDFGLDIYDCDGYAGHAELKGTTDEVLGILGHLDVVPAKADEWRYPPYAAEIHDGKMYGRGTMDDKGPMIACLFAVKALKDAGFVPSKTVRLIFGCDEESGMECVEHYFKKVAYPTVSFSPDGDFPVINREKGIYQFDVVCGKLPQGVSITAGDRANVVPSLCAASLPADVALPKLTDDYATEKFADKTVVTAIGKAAHGSTPDEGVNAARKILKLLTEIYP
ncbi:MAG: Sapep family Mn(2+)-dependent dipeptidase, partial [Corallococcus sp.]|nr:Sapep family Mn(2+)-dependent dipeptidase [Corallococcus sp.]